MAREPVRQQLADVQCRRLTFEPGSAILVKVNRKLAPDEEKKIRRAVEKWARCGTDGVEVLIVNTNDFVVEYVSPAERANLIILPKAL